MPSPPSSRRADARRTPRRRRLAASFDCRFELGNPTLARDALRAGAHSRRAVYLHLDRDLSGPVTRDTAAIRCRDPRRLRAHARALGHRRSDTQVVAYDAGNGAYAARLWWLLRWVGHDARRRARRRIRALARRRPAGRRPTRRAHRAGALRRAPATATRGRRGDGRSSACARRRDAAARRARRRSASPAQVETDRSGGRTRAGRRNHPFLSNLGADGRFLPAHELRARFERSRSARSRRSHDRDVRLRRHRLPLLLALEHAGLAGARLYAGSWSEWIRDPRGRSRREATERSTRAFTCAPYLLSCAPTCQPIRDQTIDQRGQRPHAAPSAIAWNDRGLARALPGQAWGKGYFCINAAGHVVVRPDSTPEREIDCYEVVAGTRRRATSPRRWWCASPTSCAHRLKRLHDAFAQAIAENDYQNRYAAVFPIKVNQQRLVVEEVYRYGSASSASASKWASKPELLAVMAHDRGRAGAPHHLQRLQGRQLHRSGDPRDQARPHHHPGGREFRRAAADPASTPRSTSVRPRIGVRVKLASEGAGRWRESAGEKSKFGLFITEILELVEIAAASTACSTACSSCTAIRAASCRTSAASRTPINELAHVYAELKLLGAGLQVHRRRRRARRRLRRQRHQLRIVDELHAQRIRERRGVSHRQRLQRARDRAPDDRQRVGPRDRRAPQRAHLQHARLLGARPVPRRRQGRAGLRRRRRCRSRCATCSTPTARSPSGAWSSAITTRCRRASRRCRCSTSATLSLELRGLAERLYWATCAKVRDY